MQRSIESFFHCDLLSLYSVFDLVQFAIISYGEIVP